MNFKNELCKHFCISVSTNDRAFKIDHIKAPILSNPLHDSLHVCRQAIARSPFPFPAPVPASCPAPAPAPAP